MNRISEQVVNFMKSDLPAEGQMLVEIRIERGIFQIESFSVILA